MLGVRCGSTNWLLSSHLLFQHHYGCVCNHFMSSLQNKIKQTAHSGWYIVFKFVIRDSVWGMDHPCSCWVVITCANTTMDTTDIISSWLLLSHYLVTNNHYPCHWIYWSMTVLSALLGTDHLFGCCLVSHFFTMSCCNKL